MRQVQGIEPHLLWIGTAEIVQDLQRAVEAGVTAVVDVAGVEPTVTIPPGLQFCRFPLIDGLGNPPWLLQTAIRTTADMVRLGIPTLVACSGGMSRSPVVLAAALAAAGYGSLDECLRRCVSDGPRQVSPAFWQAVVEIATNPIQEWTTAD